MVVSDWHTIDTHNRSGEDKNNWSPDLVGKSHQYAARVHPVAAHSSAPQSTHTTTNCLNLSQSFVHRDAAFFGQKAVLSHVFNFTMSN